MLFSYRAGCHEARKVEIRDEWCTAVLNDSTIDDSTEKGRDTRSLAQTLLRSQKLVGLTWIYSQLENLAIRRAVPPWIAVAHTTVTKAPVAMTSLATAFVDPHTGRVAGSMFVHALPFGRAETDILVVSTHPQVPAEAVFSFQGDVKRRLSDALVNETESWVVTPSFSKSNLEPRVDEYRAHTNRTIANRVFAGVHASTRPPFNLFDPP